ncbi:MAG: sulfatase-like hydrolase/transferase [Proteobacteria bacterium]|nr:sulfatase-like hydrolase/transferase [Pseudomonadota bacterium]
MPNKRPNFLFIITDQQRADHVGCYGNPILKTPHIDSIAARGLTFDKYYVASPTCMPNRCSLITGRMPSAHGVLTNGLPLSLDTTTFLHLLQAAGYKTALMGKAHLQNFTNGPVQPETFPPRGAGDPPPPEYSQAVQHPLDGREYANERMGEWIANDDYEVIKPYYGFDEVLLAASHGDRVQGDYSNWLAEQHPDPDSLRGPENALENADMVAPQAWRTRMPEELYPTSWITDITIDSLERYAANPDQPFFIQCGYTDPHHPFTPPGKYWDMYDPADIPAPESLGADHIDPPPFLNRLRKNFENGTAIRNHVHPSVCDAQEAREMIALTYGMISMVDDGVGKILAKLDELGLAENTVVIYTSDHGDMMGDHGAMLKHGFQAEGVVKVPFIWSDPDAPEAARTDLVSSAVDFAPSILARAGLEPFQGVQGYDVVTAARNGEALPRSGIIVEADELPENTRIDHFFRVRSFIDERWRMTLWLEDEFGEFYDRDNDPLEIHNLWNEPSAQPDKARIMEKMLWEQNELIDLSPRPIFMG